MIFASPDFGAAGAVLLVIAVIALVVAGRTWLFFSPA